MPPGNIDDFKSLIARRGGLARSNRFEVEINLPRSLAPDGGRDLKLLCESAILPGKQITSTEWSMFGHSIKIPTNFIQEDVTCIFNITNDYYVKRVFDRWQNSVINNETFLMSYHDEFKQDVFIRQLDENDKPIYETQLMGAFPIAVQPIVLDNNAEQQTQKVSVTFSYTNYRQR